MFVISITEYLCYYSLDMKDEHKKVIKDMTPLPGETTPEDAAEMVLFLVSNRASRLTGQIFNVYGGLAFRA